MSLIQRRKLNYLTVICTFIFLWANQVQGTSLKSKLELGGGGYDETLTGEGDFIDGSHAKGTDDWSWSMELGFSQAPSTSATSAVQNNVVDHSYTFIPETGYEAGSGLGSVFNYTYSYTPEESLVDSGPEMDIYYNFFLEEKGQKGDEETFRSSLKLKMGAKDIQYIQTFNGTRVGLNKKLSPTTGFNNLRQIGALGEASASPSKLLSASLTYTYYFYDRNVGDFLNFITAPGAARLGAGGFSSAITNFAQSTLDFDLTLYPLDNWSVELEFINSVSAIDLSLGWTYDATLTRTLGNWAVGLGCERDTSPLVGLLSYLTINVAYDFN